MNISFKAIGILTLFLLILIGCEDKKAVNTSLNNGNIQVWADTIIYDVLISNPDSLNTWESMQVKNVRQQQLVDDLFKMIYSGKKKAYNYYSNEKLSIDEVREMEVDDRFSREKVGKLQFRETWLYDENTGHLKKEIHSILLAYEVYDDENKLRGYKAAFYLKDF